VLCCYCCCSFEACSYSNDPNFSTEHLTTAALKKDYNNKREAAALAAKAVRSNVQHAKAAVPKPQFCQLLSQFVALLQGYDVVIMSYEDFAVSGACGKVCRTWHALMQ
jgi:hypothetical protein